MLKHFLSELMSSEHTQPFAVFYSDAVLWNRWLTILCTWRLSVLRGFHVRLTRAALRAAFTGMFPLSAIVRCDTGAEISPTAIDGLWRGALFSFLLWAKFRCCSHLCWCQPPQQDDHQSRWCHCYLTVRIITSEPKWESDRVSLGKKHNQLVMCEMKMKDG